MKQKFEWRHLPSGIFLECAADGCNEIATHEFDAGGVVSTYCGECKRKIDIVICAVSEHTCEYEYSLCKHCGRPDHDGVA